MTQDRLVEVAMALYDPNHCHRSFHVCFVLYKHKIISIGKNNRKTNPMNLRNPKYGYNGENISDTKTICAEFDALMKMKKMTNIRFDRVKLFNLRISRNREVVLAKPCGSCQSLIRYLGIREVWFTNNEGKFELLRR